MNRHLIKLVIVIIMLRIATGCGTIIHGSGQDVSFSSSPDTAEVWIDSVKVGVTPTTVELHRKSEYVVTVKKAGYQETTVTIERSVSGWLFGNIVFGGIIGCAVDIITGGAYTLSPDRVDIKLSAIAQLDGETIQLGDHQLESLKELRFVDDTGQPEIVVSIVWAE